MTVPQIPQLTIEVSDYGTSFSGVVNLHRYDCPSSTELVASVRSMLGSEPAGAWVHLIAETKVAEEFAALTGDYDITLTVEEVGDAGHGGDVGYPEYAGERASISGAAYAEDYGTEFMDVSVQRPALAVRAKQNMALNAAVVACVVAAVGLACVSMIWLVSAQRGADESAVASPPTTSPVSSPQSPTSTPRETTPPQEPETVVLEQDGLSVELPVGFRLEPDEDMWRATGPDPDFRLQLAVDPLYGVSPRALIEQVKREIEEDPELTVTASDEFSVHYSHHLPDGSQATWKTWVDGDQQLSIGCHTRLEPTVVQKTACTMANESARFTARGEGVGEAV